MRISRSWVPKRLARVPGTLVKYAGPAFAGMTLALSGAALATDDFLSKSKPPVFLPVDQAFELEPLVWKDGVLEVSWHIHKDYYLYRDRLKFSAPPAIRLGKPVLPASVAHEDEHFGTTQVYRDRLVVQLPLSDKSSKGPVSVTVVYQGCADAGLCYPPQTRTIEAKR